MEIGRHHSSEEIFKDIGLTHLGTPESPQGTQLIHRINCPHGQLFEDKLDEWLAKSLLPPY